MPPQNDCKTLSRIFHQDKKTIAKPEITHYNDCRKWKNNIGQVKKMQSQDKQKFYDYCQKLRDMIQAERDLTLQCSRQACEAHRDGEHNEAVYWDKQALEHCIRRNALSEALDVFAELNRGNLQWL